ncbi:MAG: hypothetical protein JWL79_3095 [Frankiales bacterium]|nr:hypothetical protein [Frankiales bacterium]
MNDVTTTPTRPAASCPSWCTTDHLGADQALHEEATGLAEHIAGIGGFWQHEIRGGGDDPIVLRPRASLVDVLLQQHEPLDDTDAGREIAQAIISTPLEGLALALTGSECRSLAAMLVDAANRLEGLR